MTKELSPLPPRQLFVAAPENSVLIEAHHGGSWHTAIFLDPLGQFWRVKMETDYRPEDITIKQVRQVETRTIHYEVVK